MAKKVVKEESARPAYLNADGTLEISKIFKHQPKQTELLEMRPVQGAPYVRSLAPQCLSVGGIRRKNGWRAHVYGYELHAGL